MRHVALIVCGSRGYPDTRASRKVINERFAALLAYAGAPEAVTIIHGDARGADRIAARLARAHGFTVLTRPADWDRLGRSAGPRRNAEMLECLIQMRDEISPPHELYVMAFVDVTITPGTRDMLTRARAAGIHYTCMNQYGHNQPF